jgi:hypothetical protein
VWLSNTGTASGSGAGGNSPARRAARSARVLIADQRDTRQARRGILHSRSGGHHSFTYGDIAHITRPQDLALLRTDGSSEVEVAFALRWRAVDYPVSTLSRRAEQALWRGVPCWVLLRDDRWARLRLIRPDGENLAATGARCYECGVYEMWAPLAELADHHAVDIAYEL